MVERPGGSRDDERVSEPVLEWLDEIAEAEGLSREAAVEYLVSSYWRLEEIVDLLEADAGSTSAERSGGGEADRSDLDDLHARFDSLLDDLQANQAPPTEEDEFRRSVVQLGDRLERLEGALDHEPAEEPSPDPDAIDDRLATLEARLESLQATVDTDSGSGDDLAAELDDVERQIESLVGEVAAVEERVDALADSAVTDETLSAVTEQARSFQDTIARRHDTLQDRVHTEFDHIRTILEHLLEATQANEARTEQVVEEFEGRYRSHLAAHETLAAITRTANRRGVSTADCEHCGESVDIAMLQTPECPSCEHAFDDLRTTVGPFGLFPSSTLQVRGSTNGRSGTD